MTALKLSIAIYPPGSWLRDTSVSIDQSEEAAKALEPWNIRSTLTSWTWSCISEWEEDDDNNRGKQALRSCLINVL